MASLSNLDEMLFGSASQKAAQVSVLVPKPPLPADLAQLVSHATTNERTSVMQGEAVAIVVLVRPPALSSVTQMWHNYFSHMNVVVKVLQPLEQKVNIGQKQATHKFLGAPASLDSVNLAVASVVPVNSHGDVTSCFTSRLMGVVSDYYVYRCDVVATVPSSLSSTKLLLSISISPSSFPLDELAKGFQGGIFASSIALGNASQFLSAIDARSMRSQSSRKDLTRTLYKDLQVEDPMLVVSRVACVGSRQYISVQISNVHASRSIAVQDIRFSSLAQSVIWHGTLDSEFPVADDSSRTNQGHPRPPLQFPVVLAPSEVYSFMGLLLENVLAGPMIATDSRVASEPSVCVLWNDVKDNVSVHRHCRVSNWFDSGADGSKLSITMSFKQPALVGRIFLIRFTLRNSTSISRTVSLSFEGVSKRSNAKFICIDNEVKFGLIARGMSASQAVRFVAFQSGTLQLEGIEVIDMCEGASAPSILQLHNNFSVLVRPSFLSDESNASL